MKKDLKILIATLGIIGITYTAGFIVYQKNLFNDYRLNTEKEKSKTVESYGDTNTESANSITVPNSYSEDDDTESESDTPKRNTYRSRQSQAS